MSSVDPAEAAAEAKEREKGWNAGTPRRANADGARSVKLAASRRRSGDS